MKNRGIFLLLLISSFFCLPLFGMEKEYSVWVRYGSESHWVKFDGSLGDLERKIAERTEIPVDNLLIFDRGSHLADETLFVEQVEAGELGNRVLHAVKKNRGQEIKVRINNKVVPIFLSYRDNINSFKAKVAAIAEIPVGNLSIYGPEVSNYGPEVPTMDRGDFLSFARFLDQENKPGFHFNAVMNAPMETASNSTQRIVRNEQVSSEEEEPEVKRPENTPQYQLRTKKQLIMGIIGRGMQMVLGVASLWLSFKSVLATLDLMKPEAQSFKSMPDFKGYNPSVLTGTTAGMSGIFGANMLYSGAPALMKNIKELYHRKYLGS